jgi:RNA recognition motif-containing protein
MGTNLFVANLAFDTNDDHLAQLFAGAGTVTSAHVVTDKFTGQSRRYGFVEMSTEAEAAQAIRLLNGQAMQGRALAVSEARPREERSSSYGGGRDFHERRGGGYGGRSSGDRRSTGGRSRY